MEALTDVYLQEATEKDCALLFQWVNDPVVRRSAFQTAYIPYEKHVAWFHKVLGDNTVQQYILYHKGVPVGQIRLNIEDNVGLIDYSIAPDMRGQGFAGLALTLLREIVEKEITCVSKLVGQVKYENTASIKAFERCGYIRTEKEDYIEFELDFARLDAL